MGCKGPYSCFLWRLIIGDFAVGRWSSLSPILLVVFHSRPTIFMFLIIVRTTSSSSRVNSPILISSWLGLSVTLRYFLIRFLKWSLHICIRSPWLVAFSLALKVFFFLLTLFTVCRTIQDCISSEFLIYWSALECILFQTLIFSIFTTLFHCFTIESLCALDYMNFLT